MAWIAVNQDNNILGMSFNKDTLDQGSGITHQEISDQLAADILDGKIQLRYALVPAPAVPQPPQGNIRPWSTRYPAMMDDVDTDAVAHIARLIPTDGVAVEVGSRLGGTAKNMLDHAQLKRLYCFDPEWASGDGSGLADPMMDKMRATWQLDRYSSCRQFAEQLLAGHANVRLLPLASPYDISGWWRETVDCVFEDSSHGNPQLRDTLDFWVPLVKSGGIIAGHDYASHWAEVVSEVNQLRDRLGAELQVGGTVWWMIKP